MLKTFLLNIVIIVQQIWAFFFLFVLLIWLHLQPKEVVVDNYESSVHMHGFPPVPLPIDWSAVVSDRCLSPTSWRHVRDFVYEAHCFSLSIQRHLCKLMNQSAAGSYVPDNERKQPSIMNTSAALREVSVARCHRRWARMCECVRLSSAIIPVKQTAPRRRVPYFLCDWMLWWSLNNLGCCRLGEEKARSHLKKESLLVTVITNKTANYRHRRGSQWADLPALRPVVSAEALYMILRMSA